MLYIEASKSDYNIWDIWDIGVMILYLWSPQCRVECGLWAPGRCLADAIEVKLAHRLRLEDWVYIYYTVPCLPSGGIAQHAIFS